MDLFLSFFKVRYKLLYLVDYSLGIALLNFPSLIFRAYRTKIFFQNIFLFLEKPTSNFKVIMSTEKEAKRIVYKSAQGILYLPLYHNYLSSLKSVIHVHLRGKEFYQVYKYAIKEKKNIDFVTKDMRK